MLIYFPIKHNKCTKRDHIQGHPKLEDHLIIILFSKEFQFFGDPPHPFLNL